MNVDVDSGKLLYGIGVVLGIAALLYFARDLVFDLSITVKAALLLLAFLGFLAVGLSTERDVLDAVAYVLAAGSYVVFLTYVVRRYSLGNTGIFLALALSSALFLALGYLVRERDLRLAGTTIRYVVLALVVLAVVLAGVDAAAGGVTYDLRTPDSVTVQSGPADVAEVTVGTITARNGVAFTRSLDPPRPSGCLYAENGTRLDRVHTTTRRAGTDERPPATIRGGQTIRLDVVAYFPRGPHAPAVAGTYAVTADDACPDRITGRAIVLAVTDLSGGER